MAMVMKPVAARRVPFASLASCRRLWRGACFCGGLGVGGIQMCPPLMGFVVCMVVSCVLGYHMGGGFVYWFRRRAMSPPPRMSMSAIATVTPILSMRRVGSLGRTVVCCWFGVPRGSMVLRFVLVGVQIFPPLIGVVIVVFLLSWLVG